MAANFERLRRCHYCGSTEAFCEEGDPRECKHFAHSHPLDGNDGSHPMTFSEAAAGGASEPDAVHQPPHYTRWKMQPVEFLMINDVPGWLFNVVKYCFRYDAKDGLQDLYKARSYLDMKIRQLEGHERFWEAPVATERKLNVQQR